MRNIFCYCDYCQKPIYVGDKMVSVTLSTDYIDSEYSVQPLQAETVATWCEACAPIAVNKIVNAKTK